MKKITRTFDRVSVTYRIIDGESLGAPQVVSFVDDGSMTHEDRCKSHSGVELPIAIVDRQYDPVTYAMPVSKFIEVCEEIEAQEDK